MNLQFQEVKPPKEEIKPFYTIVLNSQQAYATAGTGANTKTYNINWAAIMPDDCPYEVHWCFLSETTNIAYNTLPLVFIDFNGASNVYSGSNLLANTSAPTSQYMGFVKSYITGANAFFHAENMTNMPIYFNSRPNNNVFTVRILNNDNPPSPYVPTTGVLGEYLLILNFYRL